MLLKIDFDKAYDNVDCDRFILDILIWVGFTSKFIDMMFTLFIDSFNLVSSYGVYFGLMKS